MIKEFEELLEQYWDLAYLEGKTGQLQGDKANEVLHALRLLAEQPAQQEPVAWMHPDGRIWTFGRGLDKSTFTVPLYTSPPQRTWVGLTDKQRLEIADDSASYGMVLATEAKLKEKNT